MLFTSLPLPNLGELLHLSEFPVNPTPAEVSMCAKNRCGGSQTGLLDGDLIRSTIARHGETNRGQLIHHYSVLADTPMTTIDEIH